MSHSSRRYALVSILALAVCHRASARFNSFFCGDRLPWNTQFYPVELDDFEDLVDDGKIDEQQTPELCWAAAIHALLVYHGADVTQEEVYSHVKGRVHSADTATIREIIRGFPGRSADGSSIPGTVAEWFSTSRAIIRCCSGCVPSETRWGTSSWSTVRDTSCLPTERPSLTRWTYGIRRGERG
jgi:hypothetical protein